MAQTLLNYMGMAISSTNRTMTYALAGMLAVTLAVQSEAGQNVSNMSVHQRPGSKLVDIIYDLASTQTNLVAISVVISNATGFVSATHFSGDVGSSVPTGTGRKIVWDGGADLNGQNPVGLRVYLTANDGSGQVPTETTGMSLIPAGAFSMGSSVATPIHPVQLSAFFMDRTEVTKGLWDEVATWAATHGYSVGAAGGKAAGHPAQNMQWHSAVKWCNARSEREGLTPCYTNNDGTVFRSGNFAGGCNWTANGYRLPTEAEWEYAARGTGTTNRFPWLDSNDIQHTRANYWSTNVCLYDTSLTRGYHPDYTSTGKPYTSPAGTFAPNAYGLYDMAGNVFEWCWDWYGAPYRTSPVLNPKGPATGNGRVIRGGSWGGDYPYAAFVCDVAYRNYNAPDGMANSLGFRCVRLAVAAAAAPVASEPFDADFRDYKLTVTSAYGTPTPGIGTASFAWGSTVGASVQQVVTVDGKNWKCAGWTGGGSIPASGTTNVVAPVALTNLSSSIAWQWVGPAQAGVTLSNLQQTYCGTPRAVTVTTTPAVLPLAITYNGSFDPPVKAGIYTVVATVTSPDYVGTVTGTLMVAKAKQTVQFDSLPKVTAKDREVPLNATSSSGLPVEFRSTDTTVATVSNDVALIAGAGSTAIEAVQPGDENFLAAEMTQVLVVAPLTGFELWAQEQGYQGDLTTFFAADSDANGIPNGLKYAFGTNLVSGTPLVNVRWVDGRLVVEIPRQDANTIGFVVVQVKGCTDLLAGPSGWTLPVTPATATSGMPEGRAWFEASTESPSAFFRLEAQLLP